MTDPRADPVGWSPIPGGPPNPTPTPWGPAPTPPPPTPPTPPRRPRVGLILLVAVLSLAIVAGLAIGGVLLARRVLGAALADPGPTIGTGATTPGITPSVTDPLVSTLTSQGYTCLTEQPAPLIQSCFRVQGNDSATVRWQSIDGTTIGLDVSLNAWPKTVAALIAVAKSLTAARLFSAADLKVLQTKTAGMDDSGVVRAELDWGPVTIDRLGSLISLRGTAPGTQPELVGAQDLPGGYDATVVAAEAAGLACTQTSDQEYTTALCAQGKDTRPQVQLQKVGTTFTRMTVIASSADASAVQPVVAAAFGPGHPLPPQAYAEASQSGGTVYRSVDGWILKQVLVDSTLTTQFYSPYWT